ncbi:hypothetical protein TNIN_24821 [Trichonephila inaurata madagascariensis]|uniref:Uncharacterized protein n=1 Tax=Trichonephila inaurata madagascariensis TaxID=2747483 RepID=A0A8X7CTS1_9ARAC|nr:hypothetical protein TNIN_24821 [Trichonephila inaurata madagascariensis]
MTATSKRFDVVKLNKDRMKNDIVVLKTSHRSRYQFLSYCAEDPCIWFSVELGLKNWSSSWESFFKLKITATFTLYPHPISYICSNCREPRRLQLNTTWSCNQRMPRGKHGSKESSYVPDADE